MTKHISLTTGFECNGIAFAVEVAKDEITVSMGNCPVISGSVSVRTDGSLAFDYDNADPLMSALYVKAEIAIDAMLRLEKAKADRRNAKARERRAVRDDVMDSAGMKRVRGNLGGTYYE